MSGYEQSAPTTTAVTMVTVGGGMGAGECLPASRPRLCACKVARKDDGDDDDDAADDDDDVM